MRYINQHSLTLTSLVILALIIIFFSRIGTKWHVYLGVALLSVLLIIAWLFIRPRSIGPTDLSAFHSKIGSGTPVLLEFQSPY